MRTDDDRWGVLYEELRQSAHARFARHVAGRTLQPTALVHEAFLKLADQDPDAWNDEMHFRAVAARAMRQVLIDHARAQLTDKRGGGYRRCPLDTSLLGATCPTSAAPDVEDALQRLEQEDPRSAAIVELRFFGGLTQEQIAAHLAVSLSTVAREWRFARAWLYDALQGHESGAE